LVTPNPYEEPYPKATSNLPKLPKEWRYRVTGEAQALPMDRVRKLRRKPAIHPQQTEVFSRIIVSSSPIFTIPWGLNQEPEKLTQTFIFD
jgi:hypothetical protein